MVSFSPTFRRRQNGLGKKEKKRPTIFRTDILSDAVGDFGEKKAPVTFGLEWNVDESRHPCS